MKLNNTISKLESGEKLTICGLGDSLTEGWMVRKGYTEFLVEFIAEEYKKSNVNFINRGIPGDTAEGGLYRLRGDVLDRDPGLVLVQFGLNDAYMGYPVGRYRSNISAIAENIINDTEAEIILLTSSLIFDPDENAMAEEYYSAMAEVAVEKKITLCRAHDYWRTKISSGTPHSSLVQSDGVHPTVEGYRLIAEALISTIKSGGK